MTQYSVETVQDEMKMNEKQESIIDYREDNKRAVCIVGSQQSAVSQSAAQSG